MFGTLNKDYNMICNIYYDVGHNLLFNYCNLFFWYFYVKKRYFRFR